MDLSQDEKPSGNHTRDGLDETILPAPPGDPRKRLGQGEVLRSYRATISAGSSSIISKSTGGTSRPLSCASFVQNASLETRAGKAGRRLRPIASLTTDLSQKPEYVASIEAKPDRESLTDQLFRQESLEEGNQLSTAVGLAAHRQRSAEKHSALCDFAREVAVRELQPAVFLALKRSDDLGLVDHR